MDREMTQQELQQLIATRLKELPKVLQDAITSADVEKHLRELADTNKLHLDQWELLENDVTLTLLGFQEPQDLAANLKEDLEIDDELAAALAENVSHIVFEPIRAELEKGLEDPATQAEVIGGIDETMREHVMAEQPVASNVVIPATPPAPPPTEKAVRAPISASYAARQPSHERKIVEGDPYREQLI